jgi:FlaA1/EpsC-like NDP-sugar epimerase
VIAIAGASAFLLRFEFVVPTFYLRHLRIAIAVWIVVKLITLRMFHIDRRSWKFFSAEDAVQLARANVAASIFSTMLLFLISPMGFPRSIPILDLLLCMLLSASAFLAWRIILERRSDKRQPGSVDVLIYGAGRAGVALFSELRANGSLGYCVRGFVDDDPALAGMYVNGVSVYSGSRLSSVVQRTGVMDVLIAIPSATGDQMFQILQRCQQAGTRFRTVVTLGEIIEDKGIASQIREVDVQDLLPRTPEPLDHRLIADRIEGKIIMVTGAAGSIGSELCRQIAHFKPAAIVAFEVAETPLFHLEREIRQEFPDVPFYAEIGNVQNSRRVGAVLDLYHPSIIYHAAAYKHVPMMENSLFEAMENNVFGTLAVAHAAQEHGVEEFVLISSDKAVRPTSVMGATKRLCELLVLSLRSSKTRYVAVRFGNVLGSNGSVIPLFKKQIAAGGPVLVTHPEMQRYFMTIREAAQLVLQASSMGRGGEIYVLDMGNQVKIVDLARKLVLLSGLVPDVDIKIEFTGVRPGEKLYEELNLDDEETIPTEHRKIKIFLGKGLPDAEILRLASQLRTLCAAQDWQGVMTMIQEMVPEYTPSRQALRVFGDIGVVPDLQTKRKNAASVQQVSRAAVIGS